MTDRLRDLVDRFRAAMTAPRDIAALVAFRVAFGAIVAISALRFLAYGWADELFVMPSFRFSYWGFAWLPVPPPATVYALFAVLAALGAMVAVGLLYRPAVAALACLFTYLQLLDVSNYLNHYYLVSLLAALLFFIPAHRAYSLDARMRSGLAVTTLPAWCTALLRFQIAVVYVNAGLAKATTDWLLHAQPLNIWLTARTDLPIIGPYLDLPATAYVAAWVGFLFDTTIALWLSWRRTRLLAYGAVIAFHVATHLLFPTIGMFPVIMIVAALVFFDPSWPRRLFARRRTTDAEAPVPVAPPRVPAWGVAVAAAFMVAQVALPLRTHFYGGNVAWHEQGMRFSWRVMTRAKTGSVTFVVRDPASGRRWQVSSTKYLTRVQEREMAVQPDLILQLAHRIARDFGNDGHPGVEVFVDAQASLNGRPPTRLIDPSVDLARESDGIGGKRWILPAPEQAPPHLAPGRSRTL
jgi:vitamin K-dependent gamma-carboxylase